jgi:hypothetical protein
MGADVMIRAQEHAMLMEEITDAAELARAQARRERFDHNWAWFEAHAARFYDSQRGRCLCVAGQEAFVADTLEQALAAATAAHPEDDGRFTLYIPRERIPRIYAHHR